MQRLYAWVLPLYALAITFLVFFQGWPVHQQSAAEPQRVVPCTETTCKAVPPAEAIAANHANYPIPAPATTPKHLFHFVVRYEGDGLIDQNALEVCKSCGLVQADQEETKKAPEKPAPAKSAGSNLFQFIVRYEGDGIIDNSVVEFVKAYLAAGMSAGQSGKISCDPATPQCSTAPIAPQPSTATSPASKAGPAPQPAAATLPDSKVGPAQQP